MSLKIVYFESAADRNFFVWRDGAELGPGQEASIAEVHRELADIGRTGRVVRQTPTRVVRSGSRVLVEVPAEVPATGQLAASRTTKVSVVIDASTDDAAQRRAVEEAARVVREVGLVLDAGYLAEALAARQARPTIDLRMLRFAGVLVAGLIVIYFIIRILQPRASH